MIHTKVDKLTASPNTRFTQRYVAQRDVVIYDDGDNEEDAYSEKFSCAERTVIINDRIFKRTHSISLMTATISIHNLTLGRIRKSKVKS